MDGDTFDRVAIVGIAFILGGIAAMALGHLAGGLIAIGVGALVLELGGGRERHRAPGFPCPGRPA